jgi:D-3-phosphoglycerate dehydrogenase
MPNPIVAFFDNPFPSLDPIRNTLAKIGAELRPAKQDTPEAYLEVAADADALMVCYAKVPGDMIRKMKRCRIISRTGIGVDNVDLDAASQCGIVVTRQPDYCIDEVSDHAMALLLTLVRKVAFSNARVQGGEWKMASAVPIHRLRGTVMGLIGFGQIPKLVAPKAQAFGMRVVAFDPFIPAEVMKKAGVDKVEFAELLKVSDYISIHCPLTPETNHLFNAAAFRQMKPTAYLVNSARGPIVDEAALAQALDSKHIAGAALDVMEKEPPPANSPLLHRDNVLLTPHTGWDSEEARSDLLVKAAEEVVLVLSGKAPRNPVNSAALQAKRS